MAEVRFHRRVNVRFKMQVDDDQPVEYGDLMVPEPVLAANLVGTLLVDWSVQEITITAENSITEHGETNE